MNKNEIVKPFENAGSRVISTWANYPRWLQAKKNIDWGDAYTQLGEEKQISLVNEFNKEMSDAAFRMSGGANYG